MLAIVLSIGSELLRGDIVDTNAVFINRELSRLGMAVRRVVQVGDDLDELTRTVDDAVREADVIICTGGLGPTQDDLTRDAIARSLNETMYLDDALIAEIQDRFASLRRNMPESNFRQALLIPSAEALGNPHGTAPGWYVCHDGKVLAAMPGPPAEMEPMWFNEVRPRLERLVAGAIADRALMTFGLGESRVEQLIAPLIGVRPDVTVATYAKSSGVEVHITCRANTENEAQSLLEATDRQVRHRLGDAIFGVGNVTLGEVLADLLDRRRLTIAVMESATGGQLASMITDRAGSSDHFVGGIVAYTREVKEANGVPAGLCDSFGMISAEVALAMARAVRERLGADVGLGVTGIAGTEPVEGKPAGTCFVAVSQDGVDDVREIHRPAARVVAKRFFAQSALDLARQRLVGAGLAR